MGLVSPSQSNAGDLITAAAINGPVNQLAAVVNGNLDSTNLADASITTNELADGAVTAVKLSTSAIMLGYTPATTGNFITANQLPVQIPGMTVTVTIPSGGKRIRIRAYLPVAQINAGPTSMQLSIWDGAVGTGTRISETAVTVAGANYSYAMIGERILIPAAGAKTYSAAFHVSANTGTVFSDSNIYVPYISVEAI